MKFTKLSLVAAIAVSSAFAGGDIAPVEPAPAVEAVSPWSFSGDAKLYYSASTGRFDVKTGQTASIFDQASANGQAAISADVGYAINSNWKINVGMTGLMTLGLDDSIVSGTWLYAGANAYDPLMPMTSVGDALWFDTANITGTMFDGKLTMVLGRQALDTPLAFSETWNIAPNTFDAAVAIAKPMENLSLIAGYIYDGNGNGSRIATFDGAGVSGEGGFTHGNGYVPVATGTPNEISNGAWTVAAVGTFAGVTAQAWYYDVMDVANAAWLQADGEVSGFTLGAQYAWISADSKLETAFGAQSEDASAWAVKAGYKMDALNVWAAYSSADDNSDATKFVLPVANTATIFNGAGAGPVAFGWGSQAGGQSKLYTEAWWNYGLVGQAGADTFAAAAEYNVGDLAMFNGVQATLQYTNVDGAKIFGDPTNAVDMQEVTAVVGAKVYDFNVQLAYIWSQVDNYNTVTNTTMVNGDNTDTVQLYLTYNF